MLGYRAMLVHLDASPPSAERLGLARGLAPEHDTPALTCLFAVRPRETPAPLSVDISPTIPPKVLEVDPKHRERARRIFDDALASGDPAMRWAPAVTCGTTCPRPGGHVLLQPQPPASSYSAARPGRCCVT